MKEKLYMVIWNNSYFSICETNGIWLPLFELINQ